MDAAIESIVPDGDAKPPPVNLVSSQSLTSTSSGFLASSEKTSPSLSSQNRTHSIPQRPSSASLLGVSTHTHGGASKETVVNVSSAKRSLYRASTGENKSVTRDLAALDFLLGIPLAAESNIVQEGWILQRQQQQEDATRDRHYPLQIDKDASSSAFSTHYPESEKAAAVSTGTWWSKYVQSIADPLLATGSIDENGAPRGTAPLASNDEELERPQATQISETPMERSATAHSGSVMFPAYTPGRRLDGDPAVQIKIPVAAVKVTQRTMQKTIARTAAIREWERQTAHGLADHPPLLDGRLFFSASGGYPTSVFSVIRYEPKREEAEFRRKKLESLGGGGSQFVMPVRDWRGISYRVLLPRKKVKEHNTSHFNRFVRSRGGGSTASDDSKQASDIDDADLANNSVDASADGKDEMEGDESSVLSISDDESDEYVPGILDDPKMILGRHRNLMIGDHITGPIVSSTIQFVKPALLKAELNKQFRDRFDGWEPPKAARKYAGAYVSVQEGKYVLKDPTEDTINTGPPNANNDGGKGGRHRQGSLSSLGSTTEGATKEKPTLRIPPSLTLSKIRSLKQQALSAAVRAGIEVGTVALSCVYFERLCLHCRVDKSNRRLCFAACLLIASKLNEPNVGLVMTSLNEPTTKQQADNGSRFQSLIRPNKRSNKIFASLLEFFTEDWSLSLKRLLDAEWGVFAALGFSLHATPSQVAFHFKRLMKTLEWNPSHYLGPVMWEQWQDALDEEERRKREKTRKEEIKRQRKEERLLNLQLELENEVLRRQNPSSGDRRSSKVTSGPRMEHRDRNSQDSEKQARSNTTVAGGLKMFNPFGMRKSRSTSRLESEEGNTSPPSIPRILPVSSSLPMLAGIVNTWTVETCPKLPLVESAKDGDNVVAIADESESDNLII